MTGIPSYPGSALPSTEEQLADYVYSIQNYTDAKEVAAHLWPILSVAQAPADGWVLVPKEPTKEMIAAGDMLTYSQERFKVSEVYRAMLSALSSTSRGTPECPHAKVPANLHTPCQICGALGPWFDGCTVSSTDKSGAA